MQYVIITRGTDDKTPPQFTGRRFVSRVILGDDRRGETAAESHKCIGAYNMAVYVVLYYYNVYTCVYLYHRYRSGLERECVCGGGGGVVRYTLAFFYSRHT